MNRAGPSRTGLDRHPHWLREGLALLNLWGRMGYHYTQVVASCPDGQALRLTLHSSRADGGPAPAFYLRIPFRKGVTLSEDAVGRLYRDAMRELETADSEAVRVLWENSLIRRAAVQIEVRMVATGLFPPYLAFIQTVNAGKTTARQVVQKGAARWTEEG